MNNEEGKIMTEKIPIFIKTGSFLRGNVRRRKLAGMVNLRREEDVA